MQSSAFEETLTLQNSTANRRGNYMFRKYASARFVTLKTKLQRGKKDRFELKKDHN